MHNLASLIHEEQLFWTPSVVVFPPAEKSSLQMSFSPYSDIHDCLIASLNHTQTQAIYLSMWNNTCQLQKAPGFMVMLAWHVTEL